MDFEILDGECFAAALKIYIKPIIREKKGNAILCHELIK